jgi:hypothetical protein
MAVLTNITAIGRLMDAKKALMAKASLEAAQPVPAPKAKVVSMNSSN